MIRIVIAVLFALGLSIATVSAQAGTQRTARLRQRRST